MVCCSKADVAEARTDDEGGSINPTEEESDDSSSIESLEATGSAIAIAIRLEGRMELLAVRHDDGATRDVPGTNENASVSSCCFPMLEAPNNAAAKIRVVWFGIVQKGWVLCETTVLNNTQQGGSSFLTHKMDFWCLGIQKQGNGTPIDEVSKPDDADGRANQSNKRCHEEHAENASFSRCDEAAHTRNHGKLTGLIGPSMTSEF